MTALLARAAGRFYLRHPWQLALAIAGIGLGVAVYVGVGLANDSARRAFDASAGSLRGPVTHRLLPAGGELDERVYVELVRDRGLARAAPVLELEAVVGGERPVRVLGLDPLEEITLRGFGGFVPVDDVDLARLIAEPGTVLLPEGLAGAAPPAEVTLEVSGRAPRRVRVLGRVAATALDLGGDAPLVTDIATAQELFGRGGVLGRIDLRLTAEEAARLAASLPDGTVLVPVGDAPGSFRELTAAFRTNLTALGLLALVVGMFLIYATMSFAIVQRRAALGTLRALGTDRVQVFKNVLLEAAALGAVATSLGLVLGHVLAGGLVELVLRTIADLYFTSAVRAAEPSPLVYAQGAALGVGATLLAALKPAIDASRVEPTVAMRRADLERRSRRATRFAAALAAPVIIVGAALLALAPRSLLAAFAGLFCALAAGALLTPGTTVLLMRALEPAADRALGLPGTLAVRGVTASLSRTGVATAALAVAVATVIGVGLMIASFRASLADWLRTTLTADVYVTFDRPRERDALGLERLLALPGLRGIGESRVTRTTSDLGEVTVRALAPGPRGFGLDLVDGRADALERLARGEGIAIAEPFAYRHGLRAHDRLALATPAGVQHFEIVGVFRDYSAGVDSVVMAAELYRSRFRDDTLTGIGLDLAPGYDPDEVEAALRAALPADVSFRVRSSAGLERLSLAVFDRTFRITEVLRVLAATVAFLGMLSALLAIELERARETAVLRALGFAPRQLGALVLTQTALLGAAAAVAAVPLGTALAALLVHVINRRSFGWSMDFVLAGGPLVGGAALALGAALLAGAYPAWRLGRAELGRALREE